MSRKLIGFISVALALAPSMAVGQEHKDIELHVDPRWKECSFKLDRSLTQSAWRQFTKEAGLVVYFRPLADARPLGRGKFELSVHQWQTGIDDHDAAWNDTFVHPDSAHWLFEGSGLQFPGATVRAGLSRRVDAGVYFAKNPNANYGFYGGQIQYNVIDDGERNWAGSVRASFVTLFGPEDLDFTVGGVDAVASKTFTPKRWASISPYVGASAYVSRSHEKSAVVNLSDENVAGMRAMGGVEVKLSAIKIGVEYASAKVGSTSVKIGVGF